MNHRRGKSVPGLIIGRFFGLLILFIVIAGFNYFSDRSTDQTLHAVTFFINSNIVLLVLITLVFLVGDFFGILPFPVNLPAPVFNAAGAVLVVQFIFNVFGLIDTLTLNNLLSVFQVLAVPIYIIVFFIVLVGGYIKIFFDLFKPCEDWKCFDRWGEEPKKKPRENIPPTESPTGTSSSETRKSNPDWEDVGTQFRGTIYDALLAARKSMKEEREKQK